MKPRSYQVRALNQIWQAMQTKHNVLLVASCSAGKTILFSKIIQRLLKENANFRCLILVDREILVTQARDKLLQVAPELSKNIGIACASVDTRKDFDKKVTIASRQTLKGHIDDFKAVQLTILDECHMAQIPHEDEKSDQLGLIYGHLKKKNPNMRFLGCTATPYRLGPKGGYIYGDKNRPDAEPYWDTIDARITTKELLGLGFLAPVKGYIEKEVVPDFKGITLQAGEYNLKQLDNLMTKPVHIQSVVDAWKKYGKDRKKTIVFCTTINHCEKVAHAFDGLAVPVHSRNDNMSEIEQDRYQVFTSVAKLTTGLDVTSIDMIIFARPTLSPSLFIQKIGRGMRLHEGKQDCILVDLVGNTTKFGLNLDEPFVKIPHIPSGGDTPTKICPGSFPDNSICGSVLHASVRVCPQCEYSFSPEEVEALLPQVMKDVKFNEPSPPEKMQVDEMSCYVHTSKASGKDMLRVVFTNQDSMFSRDSTVSMYLMFPDWYDGYPVEKTKKTWEQLTD